MINNNNQKQASEFDNFAYNIAPQFEDGFYGYAVDKDFSMSIIQMYLDCETEEDEKRVDRALRKLRNFHLSMDRGHLKNKAKYSGEEGMFKESNFKEYVERKNPPKAEAETEAKAEQQETSIPVRATRATKVETKPPIEVPVSLVMAAEEAQKPDNRTYEEKLEGMKDFYDPTDPDGDKAKRLISTAEGMLGKKEYEIMRNAYNKPETFQRLCNLWDYFHRNIPDEWPERPNDFSN